MTRMTWPDIAHAYDVVAEAYATAFAGELERKPFDRDLLDRFAAAMAGRGAVWDIGCGAAGHLARYLAHRGVDVAGADLSLRSVAVARSRQPGLAFAAADMCRLPLRHGCMAGVVAFYSVIHLPRERIPAALAEFRRVLRPGGGMLIAMHGGDGETGAAEWFGHPVQVRATLVRMGELSAMAGAAGFSVIEQHERAPYDSEAPTQRLYIWAQAS
jgi:SAM-dependent methyltransferase